MAVLYPENSSPVQHHSCRALRRLLSTSTCAIPCRHGQTRLPGAQGRRRTREAKLVSWFTLHALRRPELKGRRRASPGRTRLREQIITIPTGFRAEGLISADPLLRQRHCQYATSKRVRNHLPPCSHQRPESAPAIACPSPFSWH